MAIFINKVKSVGEIPNIFNGVNNFYNEIKIVVVPIL